MNTESNVHEHPLLSVLLLVFGWSVNMFAEVTGEILYLWAFRTVSILSVSLIVLINWRKAISELREILKIKK